jgi:hypothetical protein
MKRSMWCVLLMAAGGVLAQEPVRTAPVGEPVEQVQGQLEDAPAVHEGEKEQTEGIAQTQKGAKVISGMSILGNQEAPKSLVIVPWKRSEIGNAMETSTMLDDSTQPVDRDVFLRALRYYEIRSKQNSK